MPSVTPEDKDWIEQNMLWFIEHFGVEPVREQPFILPSLENFPFNNLKDPDQFRELFKQLCDALNLDPEEIVIKIFDDIQSKQWDIMIPQGEFRDAAGLYNKIYETGEKRFQVQIARSNLEKPLLLTSVIVHELAHVKLLGGNYLKQNEQDLEPLTDLASIFFGFGIFVANSVVTSDFYWISRSGYLPPQIISYANALICYISGKQAKDFIPFLNRNTAELFRRDFEFLTHTHDTILSETSVKAADMKFQLNLQIGRGFENRAFSEIIEAGKKMLESDPKDISAYNYIGYALLQQKKYEEAIKNFTQAISIDPYWDYPYNNRGYCKLQLGDLDNAFTDIFHAFEMNQDNSYAWRNMGTYFLKVNDLSKALEHLEEAERMQPKTELINFYLGIVNRKLGNEEKAKNYFLKSELLNEHNDSVWTE